MTTAELVALVSKRFRWTRKEVGRHSRAYLCKILFHPETERGELEIDRPQVPRQPGDPERNRLRRWGWSEAQIDAKLGG